MKINMILASMMLSLMMVACWGGRGKKAADADAVADPAAADDKVAVIFNGENFEGWRGYDRPDVPARWSVENGAIKISGGGTGEGQSADGGDIIYPVAFKNFKLTFEWKVSKGADSGVFYYAKEITGEPIYITAPEYQILDNANHPDALLGKDGDRKSASLYDMLPAVPQNAKPFGEWNTGGIMVYKGTVVHYQNEEAVVEYHLWTPEWANLLEASKFSSTNPHWPMAFDLLNNLGKDAEGNLVGGYIGLQDHGDDVWFRNLKVEILD